MPKTRITTSITPSERGFAATAAYVDRGESRTPMIRANRPGCGVAGVAAVSVTSGSFHAPSSCGAVESDHRSGEHQRKAGVRGEKRECEAACIALIEHGDADREHDHPPD